MGSSLQGRAVFAAMLVAHAALFLLLTPTAVIPVLAQPKTGT